MYAQKFYISNFKGAISEHKGGLHCEGFDYEEFPDDFMEAPSPEPFFTRWMEMLNRPDGSLLYGKLGVDLFSTSQMLFSNLKIRLQIIRARSHFIMISGNA